MQFPHRRVDASILSSIVVSLRTADSRTQGLDDEENNLGFPILDDTSAIAAAALASDGPPNTCAKCSNSSAPTRQVLIPGSQPSSQCKPATSSDLTTSSRMSTYLENWKAADTGCDPL